MANFIRAGNIAVQKAVAARKSLADNKADLGSIGKAAIDQNALNVQSQVNRNKKAATLKYNAKTAKKAAEMKSKGDEKIAGIKKGAEKAGKLAAGIGLLGVGAMQMNKPEEENEELAMINSQRTKLDGQIADNASATADLAAKLKELKGKKSDVETATIPQGDQSTVVSTLAGGQKLLADGVAKTESGEFGYQAFNQGGADSGTTVLGKSGSYKDLFGKDLTKMSIDQVMDLQYDDKSMSDEEWRKAGKIHAAGRYQFIGSTLRDEVSKMGIDTSRMFDAGTQDEIFLSHAKRIGNISPWVGPSTKYSQAQKDELNNIIQSL